jgi:hypothetical protein
MIIPGRSDDGTIGAADDPDDVAAEAAIARAGSKYLNMMVSIDCNSAIAEHQKTDALLKAPA